MKTNEGKKADMKELRRLINNGLMPDDKKAIELVYKYLKGGTIYKKDIRPMQNSIQEQEFVINDISDIHFNSGEFYFVKNTWHCEAIKRHLMPQLLEDGIICDHSKKTPGLIEAWHL